jgi:phage replication-related protein YjqB (UPF0714/DUF867 family)
MADKYLSFEALRKEEAAGSFNIEVLPAPGRLAVVAPHAGGIEPGTSEISRLIAGEELPLYLFEGTKSTGNRDLHITSTRFDEPRCMSMLTSIDVVLAMHGERTPNLEAVFIGGLHEPLKTALRTSLSRAGFDVRVHDHLQGKDEDNICNRGRLKQGVQLELTERLRATFFHDLKSRNGRRKHTERLISFCDSVRTGLADDGWLAPIVS